MRRKVAVAFDQLMVEEDERKKKEEDDELIETRSSLMSPKLVYAKHKLKDYFSNDGSYFNSHISFIIDYFKLNFGILNNKPYRSNSCLGGLLNDFVSNFEVTHDTARWTHTIVPQSTAEILNLDKNLPLLSKCLEKHMSSCALIYSGDKTKWPSIIVDIKEQEKSLINISHQRSDWVVFIDKYFDVDFLDHPNSPFCEYYLIDYSPSPREGFGHKLIVSTASTSELRKMIAQELKELNLSLDAAPDLVDVLQTISGELAIKLLSSKNFAKEVLRQLPLIS